MGFIIKISNIREIVFLSHYDNYRYVTYIIIIILSNISIILLKRFKLINIPLHHPYLGYYSLIRYADTVL